MYFPPGTYLCDNLAWPVGVRISGSSKERSIIKARSNSTILLAYTATSYAAGFQLSQLTLDSNGKTGVILVKLDGVDGAKRIGGVNFRDVVFSGTADKAIYLLQCTATRITDVAVSSAAIGVHTSVSDNVIVANSQFSANAVSIAVGGDNWTVCGNQFWSGTGVDIRLDTATNGVIADNICRSTGAAQSIYASGTVSGFLVGGNSVAGTVAGFGSTDHLYDNHTPGATTPNILSGTGSPEAVVTAPVGALFLRTDGSTSTTLYVKTSGSGNTGWTAK